MSVRFYMYSLEKRSEAEPCDRDAAKWRPLVAGCVGASGVIDHGTPPAPRYCPPRGIESGSGHSMNILFFRKKAAFMRNRDSLSRLDESDNH